MNQLLARDERESAIDRAADRLAYLAISYGLLLVVAYRSLVERQASWELLGLVLLGGLVGTVYRLRHRVMTRTSALVAGLTLAIALAVAAIIAIGLRG
jgi:hypothetical protein